LTTSVEGQGSIIGDSGGPHPGGEEVTLTAQSAGGWYFLNWSGWVHSQTNPITITMDADKSVTANFLAVATLNITGPDVLARGSMATYSVTPQTGMTYKWYRKDASSNHQFVYKGTGTSRSEKMNAGQYYFELKVESYNSNEITGLGTKEVEAF
jgi:hypothetical protein